MSENHFIGNILDDAEDERQRRNLLNMLKPMAENKLLMDKKAEFAKFRSTSAPPEMDSNLEPTTVRTTCCAIVNNTQYSPLHTENQWTSSVPTPRTTHTTIKGGH